MIFKERLDLARIMATLVGFIGTGIVLRIDQVSLDLGAILVIGSAAIWALTMVVIKTLGRTESSLTTTGYMVILLSLLSLGPAIAVWKWPAPELWVFLVAIGVLGTFAQLLLTEALKQADAGAVMPFDFLKLIWAAALGYILFAQTPGLSTWIGGAIIFAAGTFVAYREKQQL